MMKFVSKEEQKKGMQFVAKDAIKMPISEVKQPTANILERGKQIGAGIATIGAGLGASYVAGKTLEGAGKAVYGVTLPPMQQEAEAIQAYRAGTSNIKPRTTVQTMLDQPLLQGKGGAKETVKQFLRSPSSVVGQMGTRSQVGVQSELAAGNIFNKTLNPIFEQAEKKGLQINYNDLINNAKKAINSSKKYSVTQKATILDDIAEMAKNYQGTTTLKNLDLEKQAIVSKIPSKYLSMAKIPQEAKAAQDAISSAFRDGVHTTIKKNFGVDSAKLYREYANLKGVSKIGPKALSQAGRKGGFGGAISWIMEELSTPITTTTGKLTYKTGKLLQYLPKKTMEMIKKAPGALKNMPLKSIASSIIKNAPAGILSEMVGKSIQENTGDKGFVKDYQGAIDRLKSGKKIPITSPYAKIATKGLDKETSINLLEKLLSNVK